MSDRPSESLEGAAAAPVSVFLEPAARMLREGVLTPPLRPGLMAGLDRFEILQILGEGGMGIVLLARDPGTREEVAIKLLKPELASDPRVIHQFQTEAGHMQRLAHPNILSIQEVSSRPGCPYFVVPYVKRGSLSKLVRQGLPLDKDTILGIALQVAKALSHAHEKGIIHRDLKPANVLLADNGTAYLADFGLGRTTLVNDSLIDVQRQSCEGTPAYMAPEVAAGRAGDFRCDIYAFGAMLYEMLTGQSPYTGERSQEVMEKVRAGPPTPVLKLNPKAAPPLVQIAEHAMARELRDRYAHMGDVLADLKRVVANQTPLGPHRLSGTGFLRPKTKIVLGVAVACLGLALVAAIVRPMRKGMTSEPHHITVNSPAVAVYARDGRVIWTIQVDGEVAKAELAMLERGKPKYLIVGVRGGKDTGKVFAYDGDGNLAWEKQTAEPYPYRSGAINQMRINDLCVADLWQQGTQDIAVISADLGWSPSKITILDSKGSVKRTYWHPGQLIRVISFKPSQGNRLRLLAWGCNNDMQAIRPESKPGVYYHGIACLDPETMAGEAPPRLGAMGTGTELWYALLLPQDSRVTDIVLHPPTPGAAEGSPGQGFQVATSDGTFLLLNENGELIGQARGDVGTSRDVRTDLFDSGRAIRRMRSTQPDVQTQPFGKK